MVDPAATFTLTTDERDGITLVTLGGELGFIAILHSWGQALKHHPHIHCLIPGRALSTDGQRACQPSRTAFGNSVQDVVPLMPSGAAATCR